MKKKMIIGMGLALSLTASSAMTAFGGWVQDDHGWWFQNPNSTYPSNTWAWLDGNGDGVWECYYFDPMGYCLLNTRTPDGYVVDANGAWTVNGVIQTKVIGGNQVVSQDEKKSEEITVTLGKSDILDYKYFILANDLGFYDDTYWPSGWKFTTNDTQAFVKFMLPASGGTLEFEYGNDFGGGLIFYDEEGKKLTTSTIELGSSKKTKTVKLDVGETNVVMIKNWGSSSGHNYFHQFKYTYEK